MERIYLGSVARFNKIYGLPTKHPLVATVNMREAACYANHIDAGGVFSFFLKGGGQVLVGVAGRGWYQEEGKPAVEILPGTVIHIPANVKHWHGAQKDSWFSHLAFEIEGENASNIWLDPVTDKEYDDL